MVTIVMTANGNRVWPGDGQTEDNPFTELVYPILFALDDVSEARYGTKAEISGERLIAWGSTTEAYLADLVFDWGQRHYPSLLAGTPQIGVLDGYRYRGYSHSGVYIGVKEGRLYFYQPAVDPAVQPLGALANFLPVAQQELPLP